MAGCVSLLSLSLPPAYREDEDADVITTRISFHSILIYPSHIDSRLRTTLQTLGMLCYASSTIHIHESTHTRPFLQISLPLPFVLQLAALRRRQQDARRTAGSSAKSAEDTYCYLEHARVVTEGACLPLCLSSSLSLFLSLLPSLLLSLLFLVGGVLTVCVSLCRAGSVGLVCVWFCDDGRVGDGGDGGYMPLFHFIVHYAS